MTTCPCGSGKPLDACCGPLIAGAPAPTAEALMRSRYTAYALGNIAYIAATHAPEAQEGFDQAASEDMARKVKWKGLSIESVENGGEGDETGTVTFAARFAMGGREQLHREISRFRKEDGRWLYVDGDTNPPVAPRHVTKIGRNDPCPCGSGKKYKKCCGA
jgi:SEC-C motif-containing protein